MSWNALALLIWLLIALGAWVWSRPSTEERAALGRVSSSARRRLFVPSIGVGWCEEIRVGDQATLADLRRRFFTGLVAVVLPIVLFLVIFLREGPATTPLRSTEVAIPATVPIAASPQRPPGKLRTVVPLAPAQEAKEEETLEEKRDPIRLFETAKVIPIYANEQLLGVSIGRVLRGSFWEMVGFRDGDIVLELNGVPMDTPAASVEFMNSLNAAYVLVVRVRGEDGLERILEYRAPIDE